jgi:hypothetical protein
MMIGHGRALELFLCVLKVGMGIWLIFPGHPAQVPTIADLSWYYPSVVLAMPLILVGAFQLVGWILNCAGYEISWVFRAIGAQAAIFMWFWLIFKTPFASSSSPLFVLGILCLPFSALLLYKAWNRLPIPGAPGAR